MRNNDICISTIKRCKYTKPVHLTRPDFLEWSSGFANSKGADQTAHPRSLVSAFVIRFLDNIIPKLATSKFLIF